MKNSTSLFFGASFLVFCSAASSQLPIVNHERGSLGAEVGSPSGGELHIDQFEDRAIIHWDSFSIGKNNRVIFNQEQHQAVLNRVLGEGLSDLQGVLEAGGTVWLINPNGGLIGKDARISTQSFLASTLDIPDDSAFLNPATTTFSFEGDSEATIASQGRIEALGGDVILVARQVSNQGELHAHEGGVLLAAGNEVEITMLPSHSSNPRIAVRSTLMPPADATGVNHEGIIQAAQAELAAAGGNIYSFAVNVSGNIEAYGYGGHQDASITLATEGGKINIASSAELVADAGYIGVDADSGQVSIDGRLSVQASEPANWGAIYVRAEHIDVLGNSELNASNEGGEAGRIDLSRARVHSDGHVTVHHGATITADGNDGYISVDATNIALAGTIRSADGWVDLHSPNIQAAEASIQARSLGLSNLHSVDISGSNNAISELFLGAGG